MTPAGAEIPYWRLSSFYFFYFALLGVWVPFWSLYLQELGFSALEIGYLSAIVMATRVVAPNLWSWAADQSAERMLVIRLGSFFGLIFFCGIFIDQSFSTLLIVITGYSFFWNAILAQFEVVTMGHLGARFHFYSRIRLWGSLGFVAAVALLGFVFDYIAIIWLPWILAALLACVAISSLLVREARSDQLKPTLNGLLSIVRQPPVLAFLLAGVLLQISHGPYYTFFSIYLEDIAYSRGAIGLLWALGVLAEVLIFVWMHRLLLRFNLRNIFLASLLLSALRWYLTAEYSAHLTILLFAQCLHAASFGACHAVAIELVRRYFGGGHQGQGMAIYAGLSFGGGGALGALLSGALWDAGAGITFLMAAIACLLAAVICYLWLRGPLVESQA